MAGRGVGPQPQEYISKLDEFACILNECLSAMPSQGGILARVNVSIGRRGVFLKVII